MIWWTITAFFIGGMLGMLTTALAAASSRVEELEAQLWAEYEEQVEEEVEPGASRVLFLLTTREGLSDTTLHAVAQTIAAQTNGKVIILEPEADDEEVD